MTPDELREKFIKQASPLMDQYIKAALGDEDIKSLNAGCRKEVWDLLKSIIVASADKIKIDVNDPKDILKAVESGQCTIEQGQQLLNMYTQLQGPSGGTIPKLQITMNQSTQGDSNVEIIEVEQSEQRRIR
jgi:hypothetical protein